RLRRGQQLASQGNVLRAVEMNAAHVQVHEQDRVDVVTERDHAHVTQAAHEQARSDEQYDRQGTLHDEQTHTRARATVGALAGTRLEIPREVEAQRLHTGGEPGEEAGEEGGRAREPPRAGL